VIPQALGANACAILLRELLPNVFLPLFAFFLLGVAVTIVAEGALSFLGLGVPPPISSWGSMIGEGTREPGDRAAARFLPAIAMFLTVCPSTWWRRAAGAHRSASGRAVTEPALLSVEACRSICRRRAQSSRVDQID